MSCESLFEYFELSVPHYSMFNYLLDELLLIKIDLLFIELLNFKLRCRKTESVGKRVFWIFRNPSQFTSGTTGL